MYPSGYFPNTYFPASFFPTGATVSPALVQAAGFFGLIDFTGLPVGQPVVPAPIPVSLVAGFYGFLDFVGYPVAGTVAAPIPPPVPPRKGHGGFYGAGRYTPYILAMQRERACRKQRTRQEECVVIHRLTLVETLLKKGWEAEKQHRKNLTESAIYSVLLAEL